MRPAIAGVIDVSEPAQALVDQRPLPHAAFIVHRFIGGELIIGDAVALASDQVPELGTSVFIIPGSYVKNGDERLVVLNQVASKVLDSQRGNHTTHVFVHQGKPVQRMLNGAWLRARMRAGLPQVRVHDLKHIFGRRLRAAGVSFEDRQDLLGHRSGRITTHYSAAELSKLLEAAIRVCDRGPGGRRGLVVLRRLSAS